MWSFFNSCMCLKNSLLSSRSQLDIWFWLPTRLFFIWICRFRSSKYLNNASTAFVFVFGRFCAFPPVVGTNGSPPKAWLRTAASLIWTLILTLHCLWFLLFALFKPPFLRSGPLFFSALPAEWRSGIWPELRRFSGSTLWKIVPLVEFF